MYLIKNYVFLKMFLFVIQTPNIPFILSVYTYIYYVCCAFIKLYLKEWHNDYYSRSADNPNGKHYKCYKHSTFLTQLFPLHISLEPDYI